MEKPAQCSGGVSRVVVTPSWWHNWLSRHLAHPPRPTRAGSRASQKAHTMQDPHLPFLPSEDPLPRRFFSCFSSKLHWKKPAKFTAFSPGNSKSLFYLLGLTDALVVLCCIHVFSRTWAASGALRATVQRFSWVLWSVIAVLVTLSGIAPDHSTGVQALTMLCAAYGQKRTGPHLQQPAFKTFYNLNCIARVHSLNTPWLFLECGFFSQAVLTSCSNSKALSALSGYVLHRSCWTGEGDGCYI